MQYAFILLHIFFKILLDAYRFWTKNTAYNSNICSVYLGNIGRFKVMFFYVFYMFILLSSLLKFILPLIGTSSISFQCIEPYITVLTELQVIKENPSVTEEKGCPTCPKKDDIEKYLMKHLFSADECQHKYNCTKEIQHNRSLECISEFKATKNTNHNNSSNFHEIGLLSSICACYNVPLEFTNLYQSSKKFLYALSIMNVITNTYPRIKIDIIMYDICCRVEPTLTYKSIYKVLQFVFLQIL
ncbi:hypothetical protein BDA99DRAFT_544060 [Phascolomyces articulosus]|uniref:Uncharacterized protein n=1 Tax=Phascolomyces articulosus TaxID=60185 RepID=A0AAD5JLH7_9FUNG|nr:hypothetical protein BDA99DRAFT_544060 [Phascolomyces articulosus]